MDKHPRIPISAEPVEIWYESPSVMIVKKPRGIRVHPETDRETNTLLNRLFQDNRWLADMETSITAGVLHLFEEQDHGVMLFNKADNYKDDLENALTEQKVTFSYMVHVAEEIPLDVPERKSGNYKVKSTQQLAGFTTFDIDTTEGNTSELRQKLFPNIEKDLVSFYCYKIELTLPHSGETHVTSIRETESGIPHIRVYHAPP